jgi:hypothetical protein
VIAATYSPNEQAVYKFASHTVQLHRNAPKRAYWAVFELTQTTSVRDLQILDVCRKAGVSQPGISGAGYATCIVESFQILCGLGAPAVRHTFSGLG